MKTYEFKRIGVDHEFASGTYEDAVVHEIVDNKVVVAMADGMGSARLASAGAETSTKSAFRILRRSVLDAREGMMSAVVSSASVRTAMAVASNAVANRARSRGDDVGDYDTTLMVAAFDEETGVLDYGYVGDGGIVVAYDDHALELLEYPQKGLDDSSTYALTNPSMWRFGRRDSVSSFMVVTDGVLNALVEEGTWTLDETVADVLCGPIPDEDHLDHYFGANLADAAESPVAGVVDDRSVFICWSSVAEGGGRKVL